MAEPAKEPQSPFRREALEYIAMPKALDDLMEISSPLAWILALALWTVVGTGIVWLFLGSIVTHISGKGMLLSQTEAVIYVSALEAPRLKIGMPIFISPNTAEPWEYSQIPGQVTTIENFPATPANMLVQLKNPSLVGYFLDAGPVLTLYAQINLHHHAGYSLMPGALIHVEITVRRQTPLSLLLSK